MASVFELDLSGTGTPDRYKVQVIGSPAGEASGVFELESAVLIGRLNDFQQTLLASAVSGRRVLSRGEATVRTLGGELFEALFSQSAIGVAYRASSALAAERGEALRIVLRLNAPELAVLPWESMFDASTDSYVSRREPLVRTVPVASSVPPLRVGLPLRILGLVASPRSLAALDVDKEKEDFARALDPLVRDGAVDLHWLERTTWAALHDALLSDTWHIVHFIGHGDFDLERGEGMIALETDERRVLRVHAESLVDLLREAQPMPRLVVLNACHSSTSDQTDLFSGVAATLVRGGVSAVAAMQFEISDRASIAFSRGFYTAIARGRGIDEAVRSGRVAIVGLGPGALEWITPTLYLRGEENHLFTLSDPSRRTSSESELADQRKRASEAAQQHDAATAVPLLDNVLAENPDDDAARKQREQAVAVARSTLPTAASDSQSTDQPDAARRGQRGGRPADTKRSSPVPSTYRHPPSQEVVNGGAGKFGFFGALAGEVAFSPEGRLLASTLGDDTVGLWNPHTGDHLRTLTGHTNTVYSVAFSPDGQLLASCSADSTVVLWNPQNGDHVRTLTGHTSLVHGVAFSPDGQLLASCSDDSTVVLWNPQNGDHVRTLTGHTDTVSSVAFSPDGQLLASCSDDSTVVLWNPQNGDHVRTLTGHTNAVQGVAFSPDGQLLASCSADSAVVLWNPQDGDHVRSLIGHTSLVHGVAFSPDGQLLASCSDDSTVVLWNPQNGDHVRTLTGHTSRVHSVAFSPDGQLLAARSKKLVLWEFKLT